MHTRAHLPTTTPGKKIIVYETKKLKALKTEAKKKRMETEGDTDLNIPSRRAAGM